jgi:hypothetical protein
MGVETLMDWVFIGECLPFIAATVPQVGQKHKENLSKRFLQINVALLTTCGKVSAWNRSKLSRKEQNERRPEKLRGGSAENV